MKLIVLNKQFYKKYENCDEILKKQDRPYACVEIKVENLTFAIPFRHHIHHKYAFFTIGEAGIDFTKAVVVENEEYIANDKPTIESKEFAIIKKEEAKIIYKFNQYLKQYKRAKKYPDNPRSIAIIKYSALQYFEDLFL